MIDDLPGLMYLLAHDDTSGGPYDRSRTRLLVRAAALIDLAARGRLRENGGTVIVSGTQPVGDPVLDAVLGDATGGHGWKYLVRRNRRRTLTQVEDRLVADGLLTAKPSRSPFGTRRLTVTDPSVPAALRARVSTALHADGAVRDLSLTDAALLALAAAGDIRSVVSRRDRKTYRARIKACTGSLGALAPGLEEAVRTLPMTMIAAQGGMGGG